MLAEVLAHLHNWFTVADGIHEGEYIISDGGLVLPFLSTGQYYRVVGSVFNDGVHKYGDALTDETFTGEVWALAIPQTVISLVEDIKTWQEKCGGEAASPYVSESFGGYSYTKGTAASGGVSWQTAFRGRLNTWRKA